MSNATLTHAFRDRQTMVEREETAPPLHFFDIGNTPQSQFNELPRRAARTEHFPNVDELPEGEEVD